MGRGFIAGIDLKQQKRDQSPVLRRSDGEETHTGGEGAGGVSLNTYTRNTNVMFIRTKRGKRAPPPPQGAAEEGSEEGGEAALGTTGTGLRRSWMR